MYICIYVYIYIHVYTYAHVYATKSPMPSEQPIIGLALFGRLLLENLSLEVSFGERLLVVLPASGGKSLPLDAINCWECAEWLTSGKA